MKSDRIRHQVDFERIYARRLMASDAVILVFGDANGLDRCRLGIAVSKKVGGAVVRNRWKRLLREVFRQFRHELPTGIDYLVIPRKGAKPDFHAIARSLKMLSQQVARRVEKQRRKDQKRLDENSGTESPATA